jgi:ribosomal protein L11 methyltransferase
MFSLEIESPPEKLEFLIAELWEQGSAGIAELDGRRVRAFFDDDADRQTLAARYPGARWRQEEQRDWVQTARDLLQPMAVGKRFFLVPEWRGDPAPEGRFRIVVNPGMAFGTGMHETTQLCMEALEDYLRPGMTVLDVGTGSGILAEAARLLGASRVWGCDIDEDAVRLARDKAPLVFTGSAHAVRGALADLAVANISPEAITALAPEIFRALRPGGIALFSGFERHEAEQVKAVAREVLESRVKGNWGLVISRAF